MEKLTTWGFEHDVAGDTRAIWLEERRNSRQMDAAEQDRIRKRVMSIVGSLSGGDPHRAACASERVREILKEKYASDRSR
jgi:hypothetical protein